jgi:hypothetical protein
MALEYELELQTELDPRLVVQILRAALDIERGPEPSGTSLYTGSEAIGLYVDPSRETHKEIIDEAYGFRPDISIGSRIPWDASVEGVRLMVRGMMALLHRVPGDAVLLQNGELTRIWRQNGKLEVNEDWQDADEVFAEITLPYERRKLPSPLLH